MSFVRKTLFDISVVPRSRNLSESLALPCEDEEGQQRTQGQETCHDETILQSHVGIPRCDGVGKGETHGIANNND